MSSFPGPEYAFNPEFYDRVRLLAAQSEPAWEHLIAGNHGYGFRVEAGQAWRFVAVGQVTGLDVLVLNADEPSERYAMSTQVSIEGLSIAPGTRIWGTPPQSRPLCTMIADTVSERLPDEHPYHLALGGHCNPHEWVEVVGWQHPRTCEDNLRAGAAMLGLGPDLPGENLNLNQRAWIDRSSGFLEWLKCLGRDGDYIELFAEVPLHVVVSLCPSGAFDGPGVNDASSARWQISHADFEHGAVSTPPCLVQVRETGIEPLPAPQ